MWVTSSEKRIGKCKVHFLNFKVNEIELMLLESFVKRLETDLPSDAVVSISFFKEQEVFKSEAVVGWEGCLITSRSEGGNLTHAANTIQRDLLVKIRKVKLAYEQDEPKMYEAS